MAYKIINLKDIYNAIGEEKTKEKLREFSCSLNNDVEYFLKEKAIEFSKQDISRTYIVMSQYKNKDVIVGYFAITNKVTNIKKVNLSKTKRKNLLKFAVYDKENKNYSISLPLIGQIGKNYTNNFNKLISGDLLLKLAFDKIKEAQEIVGGRFVFIECEDKQKLLHFYESNGFVCFGKRNLEKDEIDKNTGKYLLQMLCDLSKK